MSVEHIKQGEREAAHEAFTGSERIAKKETKAELREINWDTTTLEIRGDAAYAVLSKAAPEKVHHLDMVLVGHGGAQVPEFRFSAKDLHEASSFFPKGVAERLVK